MMRGMLLMKKAVKDYHPEGKGGLTRDPAGTVFVFDLTSGIRVGRITIGQPVGSVVARAGTTQLYIAAESRRMFGTRFARRRARG